MSRFVETEIHGRIAVLVMNRSEQRNALSSEDDCAEFADACDALNADMAISAVILTGSGTAFSAGGNIKNMADRTGLSAGDPAQLRNRYRRGVQRLARSLFNLEMPVIAAVNGPAMGAGLDIACMCDIRIASTQARFAESFVKLGLIPGDGGAWLLQRIVGVSAAAELAFTGRTIDAAEALRIGLVSSIVDPTELKARAMALAGEIAANPPQALRDTKRLLREAQNVRFEAHLEDAARYQAAAHHAADHIEAVRAVLEKRQPNFFKKNE